MSRKYFFIEKQKEWIKDGKQDVKAKLGMVFIGDDSTTGISVVERHLQSNLYIYNLQGQRFERSAFTSLPAGIYIVNGKKIMKH